MTEPDPVAALGAQLEELRGQLARAQGEIGHLRARLDAIAGQTAMLLVQVKGFRDEVAETTEKRKLTQPPAPWWCVSDAESQVMLTELAGWVETFLRRHYPGYATRLPRCWSAHGEAVWELSTLRAEWERIYAEPDNAELQGALNWHDKWLPGALNRLAASIKCDEAGCRVRSPPRA